MKYLKALILFSVLLSFSANALLEINIIKSKEELTQKDGVIREPSWSNYSN